jgi:hypothetical protein
MTLTQGISILPPMFIHGDKEEIMAIIENKVLSQPEFPPDFSRRIGVKFKPDIQFSYSNAAEDEFTKRPGSIWSDLSQSFKGITLVPYFSTMREPELASKMKQQPRVEKAAVPVNFRSYYAIECPADMDPQQVAIAVAKRPNVETTEVEVGPAPQPLNPDDAPKRTNQHYFDSAPALALSIRNATGFLIMKISRQRELRLSRGGSHQDFHGYGTCPPTTRQRAF